MRGCILPAARAFSIPQFSHHIYHWQEVEEVLQREEGLESCKKVGCTHQGLPLLEDAREVPPWRVLRPHSLPLDDSPSKNLRLTGGRR
jgi:hypothetical protein